MTTVPIGEISERLFQDVNLRAYAVVDGASIPNILDTLQNCGGEYVCLYRGELDSEMSAVAPYVVSLHRDSPIVDWFIGGFGNHWGIVAVASAKLSTMRNHFRKFLMVYDEKGNPAYFRFYDPRVIRTYLSSCNDEEAKTFFGPVETFLAESEIPGQLLCFYRGNRPTSVGRETEI